MMHISAVTDVYHILQPLNVLLLTHVTTMKASSLYL